MFGEKASITRVRPRVFKVVALDCGQQSVDLVGISRSCKALEECDVFVVVAEDGLVKLLEAKVDSS